MPISSKILRYIENCDHVQWALSHLMSAHNTGFYGKVTLQFEAGQIVILRKEQTQKPPRVLKPNGGGNGKEMQS